MVRKPIFLTQHFLKQLSRLISELNNYSKSSTCQSRTVNYKTRLCQRYSPQALFSHAQVFLVLNVTMPGSLFMSDFTLYIPHSLHQQFPSQSNHNSISCGEVYSLELTPHPAKPLTSNTLNLNSPKTVFFNTHMIPTSFLNLYSFLVFLHFFYHSKTV